MVYRDRLDMVRNLLEVANDNDTEANDRNYMSKTRLGFTASLTHTQTTTYLDELLDRGLIVETGANFNLTVTIKSQKEGVDVWSYLARWTMI